jgi:uncharacterized repeat protein (TIGR04138 family)
MNDTSFNDTVEAICVQDSRYNEEAYYFIRDALDYATKTLKKPRTGPQKHISGAELQNSIRDYAIREFGPMSLRVLNTWGLFSTEDIGEVVFNLVDSGILGKTEDDTRKDFANGYDFREAFEKPFIPKAKGGTPPENTPNPETPPPAKS